MSSIIANRAASVSSRGTRCQAASSGPDSPLAEIARRRQASTAQVAIAWLLKRSPVMIPIPGTSKRAHLEENVAASGIELSDGEFDALVA
jgi:aryl-alcohol dehydrogenase-like predicted oxidoreductase